MILYHGTTLETGEKIIRDGKLRCDIQRFFNVYGENLKATTNGFVYFTQNLYTAYYYGNIKLTGVHDYDIKHVYIFKVDVPPDILLADHDELNVKRIKFNEEITAQETLELCGCVKVAQDISIENAQIVKLPGTANLSEDDEGSQLCRALAKFQISPDGCINEIEKEVQKRWRWKCVNEIKDIS